MRFFRLITILFLLLPTSAQAGGMVWDFYVEEVEVVNDGSYRIQLRLANPESSFYCKRINVITRYEPKGWQFGSDNSRESEHLIAIKILKRALQKKEVVEFGELGGCMEMEVITPNCTRASRGLTVSGSAVISTRKGNCNSSK
jgi:hypothetical protein